MREQHLISINRPESVPVHTDPPASPAADATRTTEALSTAAPERIELVDILRGFALGGILLANMADFTSPFYSIPLQMLWPEPVNKMALAFVDIFVTNNFFTIFSFLFGLGLSLQMMRLEARGISFVPVYLRRQMILFFIGAAHGLLVWYGDILAPYALFGCLLLVFRRQSARRLALAAAALMLAPIALSIVRLGAAAHAGTALASAPSAFDAARMYADAAQVIAVYAHGTWSEIFRLRLHELVINYNGWIGRNYGVTVFAMFLLGLAAGRMNLFGSAAQYLPLARRLQRIGLLVLIASASGTILLRTSAGFSEAFALGFYEFMKAGHIFIAFFYISTILVLAQHARIRRFLRALAAPGRMALTNYLFQSIICTSLFYSYGLGFFGSVGPAAGLVIAAAIYGVQVAASNWYLSRFRFGPVEWMWKSLTYGHRQPFAAQAKAGRGSN
jgi:uncharacterized protein